MKYSSSDIQLKLETAVLTACRQSLPLDNLEVDAIICVNVADRKEEHVVKIHQRFDVGGLANRGYSKLRESLLNDSIGMEMDMAGFLVKAVDEVVNNETLDGREQLVYNQNKENTSKNMPLVVSRESNFDSYKYGNKTCNDPKTGRSSSKHPRKSSTPRCLNPKHRQLSSNNFVHADIIEEKHHEIIENISSSMDNVYRTNNYNEESSAVMTTEDNEVVMTDAKDEKNDKQLNLKNEMFIKIEPNDVNKVADCQQELHEKEFSDSKEAERKLYTGKESLDLDDLNSSNNDFVIELNSDSESYDTTYNYTFDKSIDESLERNSQAVKSIEDSDDQSLGSSPSDLTNSMMSYNVSHILPVGTINESNGILDIPNFTVSPQFGKNTSGSSKVQGMWNDLASKKRNDIPSAVEKLSCRTCGAMFSSTRTRRRHENSTCGATRYSCIICSKLFSRKDARRRHMMRTHPLYLLEGQRTSGNKHETVQA